jgi:hypothetical protein
MALKRRLLQGWLSKDDFCKDDPKKTTFARMTLKRRHLQGWRELGQVLLLHLLQNGNDHVETGPLTRVLVHADPDQSQLFISKANESEGSVIQSEAERYFPLKLIYGENFNISSSSSTDLNWSGSFKLWITSIWDIINFVYRSSLSVFNFN